MVNKYDSDNFTSDSDNSNESNTSLQKSDDSSNNRARPSTSKDATDATDATNPITPDVLKYIKTLMPKPKQKVKKPKEIITPKVLTDEVINYLKQMSLESTKNHEILQSKAPKTPPNQSFEASKKVPRINTPKTGTKKPIKKEKEAMPPKPKPKPKPAKRDTDMPQIFKRLDI